MTKATRLFPAAVLAMMTIQVASEAHAAEAMTPMEPSANMTTSLLPGGYAGNALLPAHRSVEQIAEQTKEDHAWRNRWKISLVPLVASQSLDASSSWGMRELNPILAGPDGRFGMKAASIKFGVIGGFMGAEFLLVKKFPKSAKFFSVVNYSTAGITTGLAVHNYMLPGR